MKNILWRPIFAVLAFALFVSSCASRLESTNQQELYKIASEAVSSAETQLIEFRHDLHQYPELSGEELETSRKITTQLKDLGYDVRANVGGYGVVAVLEGPPSGPLIAFRSDMDAVLDDNIDPVPYASKRPGVRHICGHDVHTTIGIGLAIGFAEIRESLPGSIMLIFQPAEESGVGAEQMLSDGLFSERMPDAILSVHTAQMNLGELVVSPHGMLAGRSLVSVTLQGAGDLDKASTLVRDALKGVSDVSDSEFLDFHDPSVIAVDLFPLRKQNEAASLQVKAFIMSAGIENREAVKTEVISALKSVELDNTEMSISYEQALEGVNNDPRVLNIASRGIAKLQPDLTIKEWPGIIPAFSEDFGSMQREVPGVMYLLGVSNTDKGTIGFPHSPNYVADDASIILGTRSMLAASLALMTELHSEVAESSLR